MSHKIFVYGTLLRDEANAHVMATAKFLGEGTVPGTLYGFGFAPGAVHPKRTEHKTCPRVARRMECLECHYPYSEAMHELDPSVPHIAGVVHGELYEVDDETLRELDDLENEPINYTRTPVTVEMESESNHMKNECVFAEGEVYYFNHPVDGGELIASGKWRERRRKEVWR